MFQQGCRGARRKEQHLVERGRPQHPECGQGGDKTGARMTQFCETEKIQNVLFPGIKKSRGGAEKEAGQKGESGWLLIVQLFTSLRTTFSGTKDSC